MVLMCVPLALWAPPRLGSQWSCCLLLLASRVTRFTKDRTSSHSGSQLPPPHSVAKEDLVSLQIQALGWASHTSCAYQPRVASHPQHGATPAVLCLSSAGQFCPIDISWGPQPAGALGTGRTAVSQCKTVASLRSGCAPSLVEDCVSVTKAFPWSLVSALCVVLSA